MQNLTRINTQTERPLSHNLNDYVSSHNKKGKCALKRDKDSDRDLSKQGKPTQKP